MAGRLNEVGEQYSLSVALVYVFNLIVGTGALTMPKAVGGTGWLLGVILIVIIAFTSFVTATFTIECMACANALGKWTLRQKESKKQDKEVADSSDDLDLPETESVRSPRTSRIEANVNNNNAADDERLPLIDRSPERESAKENPSDDYDITERIEFGEMASMFFNKYGVVVFYLVIVVYLYGDLAIYGAAVPKSMRDVVCNYVPINATNVTKHKLNETDPCFRSDVDGLTRFEMYQILLTVFFLLMLPFTFFNAQKTMWLQIITTVLRWVSFLMMIIIAVVRIAGVGAGSQKGHVVKPKVAEISGVPNLFGAAIYSFMCHHSLPSLISPIKDKSKTTTLFVLDYSLIFVFYVLLSLTAVYAFDNLEDLYSLNFSPFAEDSVDLGEGLIWVQYFIALFPVFTISASFPIIAITLRNNLKTLFQPKGRPYHKCVDRALFPLIAIIPPIFIVYFTNDVSVLVGITGAYAGAGIQYLLPSILVFEARRHMNGLTGPAVKNKHQSPFKQQGWIWVIVAWCCVALIFVTWNLIKSRVDAG